MADGQDSYDSYTLYLTGNGKRWVSILHYALYILHRDRDREPLLPPATKLGQGYVFTGICHSVNRGEYLTRQPPGTRYIPRDQVHPRPGTPPWDQVHPPDQVPPWDQVHPLGPGTPPGTRYTPRHRSCWEIRSTRGRYASYWNAFLFSIVPIPVLFSVPVPCSVYEPSEVSALPTEPFQK